MTARLQRLARKGDRVEVGPYEATVLEVANRRVQRLRLEWRSAQEEREMETQEAEGVGPSDGATR